MIERKRRRRGCCCLSCLARLVLACVIAALAVNYFLNRDLGDYRVAGKAFVDEYGREIVLRGANAGGRSKMPPFVPFDAVPDFDTALERYAGALDGLGFNVVRLLVIYEAAEPVRGEYDEEYLEKFDRMVEEFSSRGFKIIVDSHQDVFSRRFCGDGFPDWMLPEEYRDRPARSDCVAWEGGYLSKGVGRSFDRLWSNQDGVLDRYVEFFGMLAERYKGNRAVMGFEPVNEPFPGWWGVLNYKEWHEERLYKFYEHVGEAVHGADPRYMIFADICPVENPGLWDMDRRRPEVDNLVLAPHYYDMGYMKFGPLNLGGGIETMRTGLKKHFRMAEKWGAPVFVGEYGVSMHRNDAKRYLTRLYTVFDEMQLSGTIWEASMSGTLWNMRDKAILNTDGTPREAIYAIVRPYPRAVAGTIKGFAFDPKGSAFSLDWSEKATVDMPTEVYLPERIYGDEPKVILDQPGAYRLDKKRRVLMIAPTGKDMERSLKVIP